MGISWSSRRRSNSYYYPQPYLYTSEPQPYICPYTTNPIQPPYPYNYYPPPGSFGYGNPVTFVRNQPLYAPACPGIPVFVETHQKVRNHVNVLKDTLTLEIDQYYPDRYLVSFLFDALFDGSITIFYFAKEETNCKFVPLFPEAYMPVRISFHQGIAQRFCQPSGTGIDLGFFELNDLSIPSLGEEVFPLVIAAETYSPTIQTNEPLLDPILGTSHHMQITQAVLEKSNENTFQAKVVRQILWVGGVRYELREIYGIGNSAAEDFNDSEPGKQCVVCMTEPKDTAVLPCRHMCMCADCAKEIRIQSNKCPICRQPIEELIEIKINSVAVNEVLSI